VFQFLVLGLAAKRLTRLVTTDWIGEWLLVRPAKKWARKHDGLMNVHQLTVIQADGTVIDPTKGYWRTKLTSGLDCDWCVGVWAAALAVLPLPRFLDVVRQPLLKTLAVSQLAGMLSEFRPGAIAILENQEDAA
jgi:hypothetical protein